MLEITIDNFCKCDLETINDPNNSQNIWINRRDLENETKCNWQVIFDKYKDLSTQKYKKELTPNFTFQQYESENEDENEDKSENENEDDDEYENENEDDDEAMDQNKKMK